MNPKFTNNIDFFIYTTSKRYASLLKKFSTSKKSIEYWQKIIDLLQADNKNNAYELDILSEIRLADDELAYYIDSNYKIIENFLPFDTARLNSLIVENIPPYYSTMIGIFKIIDNVPASNPSAYIVLNGFKRMFDTRLYRVGLLSDIHYEDNDLSDHGVNPNSHIDPSNQPIADINQIFNFYQNKEDVKFVCCAGDITTDNLEHLLNFKAMTIKNMSTTPFYSCFGNHDFKASSNDEITNEEYLEYENLGININGKTRLQLWNSILIPEQPQYEIHYQNANTEFGKTSYWIEVPTVNNKSDIYVFLSVNYMPEGVENDNYRNSSAKLQLTADMPYMQEIMNYVGYNQLKGYDLKIYDNSALIWLKNILENHANKRIFIFTHQFFPQKAGSNIGAGYSYGEDTWRIKSNECYCLSGIQFDFLNKLNNTYKNAIWFTGHSHYDFDTQITDRYVTICNKDFAIYKPGEFGFNSSNRYMKIKTPHIEYTAGLSEFYEDTTTNNIDKDVLYFDCPIKNGTYNIILWASSAYTPDRNFDSTLFDNDPIGTIKESVANLSISFGKNKISYDLPSINITSLSNINESLIMFKFDNIKVTQNKIRIAIHKNDEGTNWFTCAIKSIIDINTNKDITYKYNYIYSTAFGFLNANGTHDIVDSQYVPSYMNDIYRLQSNSLYQNHQSNEIITQISTGYNVHIPSATRPLASNYGKNHNLSYKNNWSSAKRDADSAGMIMDVYENYVDIRGVSFKLNDWYPNEYINKYHPLGQYRINIPSN